MSRLVTDHLPLLAGAPNGVKKLRELILELATSGRLLEADTDWRQTQLRELVTSSGAGWSPSCETRPRTGDEWGVLKVSAVSWSQFRPEENKALPAHLEQRPELEVCSGDFLISRANTAELVARSVVVENTPPHLILSDKIVRLRLSGACDPRFIQLVNSAPKSRSYYARVAGGTSSSMKNVSREQILALPVLLPSIAEQHRIVAKVDELMALCDRLETRQSDAQAAHARLVDELLGSLLQARDAEEFAECWGRVKGSFDVLFTTGQSIDALKQAVLQLAVTGRLVKTEQDASEGWVTQRIEEFCTVQGGIQKTPLRRPVTQHFPYLRVLNVQRNRINVAELERYELTLDELDRWRLNAGDLLIVEGNGSENEIGRCAIWNGEVDDCVYQNHLMRVRPHEPRCVVYLALYLNSPEGMAHMRRLAITTSGLFNLSVGKIRSIPVAMPPLAEQQRIVAKVEEFMALCDRVKAKIAQAQALNERLAGTLVEQAVSQD
jgi:type I restriction enzyme, S subunit